MYLSSSGSTRHHILVRVYNLDNYNPRSALSNNLLLWCGIFTAMSNRRVVVKRHVPSKRRYPSAELHYLTCWTIIFGAILKNTTY